jgi:integrase
MKPWVKGWKLIHPKNATAGNRGIIRKTEGGSFMAEMNRDGSRGGGRIRRAFQNITAAREWIDDELRKRNAGGKVTTDLLPKQSRDALDALREMTTAGLNATLHDAVVFFVQHHKAAGTSWTVEECVARQLKDLESPEDGGSPARPRTVSSKRNRLKGFRVHYGAKKIVEITAADVSSWLESTGAKNQNLRNYRTEIQSLFNFAEKRMPGGYLNTVARFPQKTRKEIQPAAIIQPKDAAAILRRMEKIDPRAALGFALGCFAGLRTEEISGPRGLDWSNVDLKAGTIFVPATTAKARVHRKVKITANLAAWLMKYRGETGKVSAAAKQFYFARVAACKAAGITIPHNGARHSFATYYGELHGPTAAADQLGHMRGVEIFKKHYEGIATREQAEAFFEILPGSPGKVIPLKTHMA